MDVCKIRVCRNNVIHLLKIEYKAGRQGIDTHWYLNTTQTNITSSFFSLEEWIILHIRCGVLSISFPFMYTDSSLLPLITLFLVTCSIGHSDIFGISSACSN